MAFKAFPRDQLIELATQYNHFREERRRPGVDDTVRRQLLHRMEPLERKFTNLVERWVLDDDLRRAWHGYFYHAGPLPRGPAIERPPLYVGRTESGARVVIRPDTDAQIEILVDDDVQGRIPARNATIARVPQSAMSRFVPEHVTEVFEAREEACGWLEEWGTEGRGEPRWDYALELYADGLIDENFSVTERGRRMLASSQPSTFAASTPASGRRTGR